MSPKCLTAVLMKLLEIIDWFCPWRRIGEPMAVVPSSPQEGVRVSAALMLSLVGFSDFLIEVFFPKSEFIAPRAVKAFGLSC